MGWDDWFQDMPWLKRLIALLALTVLVLGALSTPAIPDLSKNASSGADDVLLSGDEQRAEPITQPMPWPPGLQSPAIALLARTLSELARGFPPVKPTMPESGVGRLFSGVVSAALLLSTRLDQDSHLHESALGSARAPTGPPSSIV